MTEMGPEAPWGPRPRWRLGSKDPKIVRLQYGRETDTRHVVEGGDDSIAFFTHAAFAREAVEAVNAVRLFDICTECGTQGDRCRMGWSEQRACCPDCRHASLVTSVLPQGVVADGSDDEVRGFVGDWTQHMVGPTPEDFAAALDHQAEQLRRAGYAAVATQVDELARSIRAADPDLGETQ